MNNHFNNRIDNISIIQNISFVVASIKCLSQMASAILISSGDVSKQLPVRALIKLGRARTLVVMSRFGLAVRR